MSVGQQLLSRWKEKVLACLLRFLLKHFPNKMDLFSIAKLDRFNLVSFVLWSRQSV
jgi:hypothetical protein